jgi:hypothetical protein
VGISTSHNPPLLLLLLLLLLFPVEYHEAICWDITIIAFMLLSSRSVELEVPEEYPSIPQNSFLFFTERWRNLLNEVWNYYGHMIVCSIDTFKKPLAADF